MRYSITASFSTTQKDGMATMAGGHQRSLKGSIFGSYQSSRKLGSCQRAEKEPLQVLFIIMCAENISKLYHDYHKSGKSFGYTKKFFYQFLSDTDKETLGNGFADLDDRMMAPLGLKKTIKMLYAMRCDVVHEGKYYGFSFRTDMNIINTKPNVESRIKFSTLRNIVVRGCIRAIEEKLEQK